MENEAFAIGFILGAIAMFCFLLIACFFWFTDYPKDSEKQKKG